MLERAQFQLLRAVQELPQLSQRDLAARLGWSLGKVNRVLKGCTAAGWVAEGVLQPAGLAALTPYRVDNAIIMAAGMSTRFAPLSYEKPKALLRVKGEVLIEREIRQLQAAGITDITVVVGYKREQLFYLADKFGVQIVVNEDYYRYNNTSTLMCVRERLGNTYICSSDNYFTQNVFAPYVYRGYYAAVYTDQPTEEYLLSTNRQGRITRVTVGGPGGWYMLGHVYFDRTFSERFRMLLEQEYPLQVTREQLWENLYMRHLDELALYIERYPDGVIYEFDSLDELRAFDTDYVRNAGSAIFQHIEQILHCSDADIQQIQPIKAGLTNVSFRFACRGSLYVYRHPGPGTHAIISRQSEAASMAIAHKLGIDKTFIYMDAEAGWKLSHFIVDARPLDHHDRAQAERALALVRKLHRSGERTPYAFDMWAGTQQLEQEMQALGRMEFAGAAALQAAMAQLHAYASQDGEARECLCHNDCYGPNFLFAPDGTLNLIDWEYSGMGDPAGDIGTFICCSQYDVAQTEAALHYYLADEDTPARFRHFYAYTALAGYYWFVWALHQESQGKPVGDWQYIWYRVAQDNGRRALAGYQTTEGGNDK